MANHAKKILSEDDEGDLRAHFCGALSVIGGLRSNLGAMLQRMQAARKKGFIDPDEQEQGFVKSYYHDEDRGLIVYDANVYARNVAEDNMIQNLENIRRHKAIRVALNLLPRDQVEVLACVYTPVPIGRVWGLITAFGDREHAAVAVHQMSISLPGESQWAALNDLRKRASSSPKAKAELDARKAIAGEAIEAAKVAYAAAIRAVKLELRLRKRIRFEPTIGLA